MSAVGEKRYTASDFMLVYEGFAPEDEGLREALTSTGNGYFCVRGSAEWEDVSDVHYPGTYAHGVYNRESTVLGAFRSLMRTWSTCPGAWSLKLCLEGEEPLRFASILLLSYRHSVRCAPRGADA